jgi:four helix bundle protein
MGRRGSRNTSSIIHDGAAVNSCATGAIHGEANSCAAGAIHQHRRIPMSENQLIILSKSFAVDIIALCDAIKTRRKTAAIVNQLLRSGTSIGANIHEANYASSRSDFINKFQIALKECYETNYWLEIFHESQMITDEEYENAFAKCSKLRKLLIASINTAKQN